MRLRLRVAGILRVGFLVVARDTGRGPDEQQHDLRMRQQKRRRARCRSDRRMPASRDAHPMERRRASGSRRTAGSAGRCRSEGCAGRCGSARSAGRCRTARSDRTDWPDRRGRTAGPERRHRCARSPGAPRARRTARAGRSARRERRYGCAGCPGTHRAARRGLVRQAGKGCLGLTGRVRKATGSRIAVPTMRIRPTRRATSSSTKAARTSPRRRRWVRPALILHGRSSSRRAIQVRRARRDQRDRRGLPDRRA